MLLRALLVVQVRHHHVGAFLGKRDRGGGPDSGVRSGHDGDSVLECRSDGFLLVVILGPMTAIGIRNRPPADALPPAEEMGRPYSMWPMSDALVG